MKFGMRVAIGVFVTSLAGALFVIKDAGKMEIAEEAGRFLAKESWFLAFGMDKKDDMC